jgi:alanyl-tRNA synthetase
MGLERTAAVLQGVISNYDTDLFVPLLKRAAELCGVDFNREEAGEEGRGGAASLRVIADHARATTFLITDGVVPSNEGRGYVLRKMMRRAIYHGRLLGQEKPFLFEMVGAVRDLMKGAYQDLAESAERVTAIVKGEETRFAHTLNEGLGRWEDDLEINVQQMERPGTGNKLDRNESARRGEYESLRLRIPKLKASGKEVVYSGEQAFKLYDTFGLPRDFIEDLARDWGVKVDWTNFDKSLDEQRTRARASWKGGTGKEAANPAYAKIVETFKTEKDFYQATSTKDARIEAILSKSGPVSELKTGESGEVVLDRTVIYAESGGQMADTGAFYDNSGAQLLAGSYRRAHPVQDS